MIKLNFGKEKPNKEQYLSIFDDRNLSITANAGSGKTKVLTEKLIQLLVNNELIFSKPSKIVAITFTKKAASEMRNKTAKSLEEKINNEEDPQNKRKLKIARQNLNKVKISTINSFCKWVIEEYSQYSNYFGAEKSKLNYEIDDIIREEIELYLTGKIHEKDDDLILLLEYLTLNSIIENLSYAYNQYSVLTFDEKSEKEIYDLIYSELNQNLIKLFKDFLLEARHSVSLFEASNSSNNTPKKQAAFDLLKLNLIKQKDFIEKRNQNFQENLKFLNRIFEHNYIGRSNIIGFLKSIDKTRTFIYEDYKKVFGVFLTVIGSEKFDSIVLNISNIFISMLQEIFPKIQKRKALEEILDYNDQLIIAKKVLEEQAVSQDLAEKIDYLLIDEYQDTNPIQFEIAKSIIKNNLTKLIIVGDTKQSIYRFRSADVRVFDNTTSYIIDKNDSLLPDTNNPYFENLETISYDFIKGRLELPVSYRMNLHLASFINKISKGIFDSKSNFGVLYSDLICGFEKLDNSAHPHIEILRHKLNGNNLIYDGEANLIVNKVIELLNKGEKAEDIAILARKGNILSVISKKLRESGIPNELHKSSNLFASELIQDILVFLEIINGSIDNFHISLLLKSLFFGLDDKDLYDIKSFHSIMFNSLKSSKNKRFENIYRIIENLKNQKNKLEFYELINLMLINTDFYNIVSKSKNKYIINQNLDNFFDWVINYNKSNSKSINDLIQDIKRESNQKTSDLIEVTISKEKVNLLTVHASKGLEFENVFYADINTSFLPYNRPGVIENIGLDIKPDFLFDQTALSLYQKTKENEARDEEEKRILYVALTRAKKRLILSFTYQNQVKKSHLGYILDSLDIDKSDFLEMEEISFDTNVQFREGNVEKTKDLALEIPINRIEENISLFNINKEMSVENLSENYLDSIQLENLSATKMSYLSNSPEVFKERYIYGLPESDSAQFKGLFNNPLTDEEEILGTKKGVLIHAILEDLPKFIDANKINIELVNNKINQVLQEESDEDLINYINRIIFDICESPFITKRLEILSNSITELPLKMPFGDDFLTGYIDLLIEDNGSYEIWDWKTNSIRFEDKDKLVVRYLPQMKFYAYLISFFNPDQSVIKARLLLTKFAGSGVEDINWVHTFEFSRYELNEFEDEIKANLSKIRELHFLSQ